MDAGEGGLPRTAPVVPDGADDRGADGTDGQDAVAGADRGGIATALGAETGAAGLREPARPLDPAAAGGSRRRLVAEIWIVLGVAILPSSLAAVAQLADRLTREVSIAQQTTTLNPSRADRAVFDALYQLIGVAADLVPVALAIWLLWTPLRSGFRRLGLDGSRPGRDVCVGLALAACIGIPGLGLYLATRALGLTPAIAANGQSLAWWTVALLLLSALRAALLEEVVVTGYLVERLRDLGWSTWAVVAASALLRGSYHLYQGVGMAIGNVVMGVVFAWWYARRGRTAPLVVAHFLLDAVSFVGYAAALAWWPDLFG